jgi:hypothetical protein
MILVLFFVVGLFFAMVFLLELGRRFGQAKFNADPEGSQKGITAIEGSVFGLLGLIIAFTFSGALTRFDGRKQLITREVNSIGTAYLRIDLISVEDQPKMRELFRNYLDSRLERAQEVDDTADVNAIIRKTARIAGEMWHLAVISCQKPNASVDATKLLLPAMNEMFDIATERFVATKTHPPLVIFYLLSAMCLLSAFLAGYGMSGAKGRKFMHMVIFAFIMAITVYVIIDIEYPRRGFIRVDNIDKIFIDLRRSMQ